MTDDQKKKPTAGLWITIALIVVLVGYPLSIGPALYVATRRPNPEAAIEIVWPVYRPLGALAEHFPRLRDLMHSYVSHWVFPDFMD